MSIIQEILEAIAAEMDNHSITPRELYRLSDGLNGINEIYHTDVVCAALKITKEAGNNA